jgi:membrane fusion protein, multidrug efflux system
MSATDIALERDRVADKAAPPPKPAPVPPAAPAPAAPVTNKSGRRKAFFIFGALIVVAAAGYGVTRLFAGSIEETDDAYVGGNIVSVTARDGGTVLALKADNTQQIKKGEPLIELDPATQAVALASAEANLGMAVRTFRANSAAVDEASAEVTRVAAELDRANHDWGRRRAATAGSVSGEEVSHAEDAVATGSAALDLAKAKKEQAESNVQGTDVHDNPGVLAAIAAVRRAAIDLAYMRIDAPVTGVVAQRTVQLGQRVAAGMPLMSIVPLDSLWVDANFRETQLRNIRVGQPVTITADLYGSSFRYHGRVLGLAAGSGNAFALLPPQNASGNWIKIVQRVPVRIALDPDELRAHPLRTGLSVDAEVDTQDRSGPFFTGSVPPAGGELPSLDGGKQVDDAIEGIIVQNMGTKS